VANVGSSIFGNHEMEDQTAHCTRLSGQKTREGTRYDFKRSNSLLAAVEYLLPGN